MLYLWVVLCITSMQGDRLQIKSAVKVDRRNDVLESGSQATRARSGSRSGGRGSRSNRSSVGGLVAVGHGGLILDLALGIDGLLAYSMVAVRKRERAGGREGLRLGGGGRMGLDRLHD